MKSLFAFRNLIEFKNFALKLQEDSMKWQIRDMNLEARTKRVEGYKYFINIKNHAITEGLSIDDKEVISWLDSINIVLRLMDTLDSKLLSDISVIAEYHIPYTSSRIDFMLCSCDNVIIIEFSFRKSNAVDRYQYHQKMTQAASYRESMSNVLSKNINIYSHTFLVEAEYDSKGSKIKKDNYFKINNLRDYINFCFKREKINAYEEILKIN